MKILFCISQIDFADHIALSYLSAVAKEDGHETFLCVLTEDNLNDKIKALSPDMVAYATNVQGFDEMVIAHKDARARFDFISVMGGPHVTFFPDTFADAEVDAFIIGEGEWPFRDLLRCIVANESYDHVENLITAKGRNPVRKLIQNLDDIPFPDRDLTLSNTYLATTEKKTFYATRGCPFSCSYCSNNMYNRMYRGKGKIVRRFSVDRLLDEIVYVKERYRMEFLKFGDDLFAMKADAWLEEFAEKYPKRVGVPFNCYLRFDTVDEKLLDLLNKAGCRSVHLSVDSTSQHVREKVLGRRMRPVDINEKLLMIRSKGIHTWVNFMLAAPDSTLEDDLATLDMGYDAKVSYVSYATTVPMRGTDLYAYALEGNMIDEGSHVSDMNGCRGASTLTCFSEKEKNVRYNIYLLGALIAKLPRPLRKMAVAAIKIIPPNAFFVWVRKKFYIHSIENVIYKLH